MGQHRPGTAVRSPTGIPPVNGDEVLADAGRRLLSSIDGAKLEIPVERVALVRRERLLARLRATPDVRVVTVIGTAGAGKTTLLSQLARTPGRDIAWITLDEGDNDPKQLLRSITASIERLAPVDPAIVAGLSSPDSAALRLLPRVTNALRDLGLTATIVIDDIHLVTNPHALDVVAMLVERLPHGWSMVIAGRTEPQLPLARWRALGILASLGTADLALDLPEAEHVVSRAGVRARRAEVQAILEATEGWAAGVYLAALSLRSNGRRAGVTPRGDDAYISAYVESELLAELSDDDLAFLARTSILDQLTGPLCDAIAGMTGSAARLDDLARRNLLVIPVDPARRWFRYHSILRDALRMRLEAADPAIVAQLHGAAAAWLAAHGDVPRAIEHALRAGDIETAAGLLDGAFLQIYRAGGEGSIARWFAMMGEEAIESDDRLPFVAAWLAVMQGDAESAERWTALTQEQAAIRNADGGDPRAAAIALLRALQCRDGIDAMRADVDLALELEPAHGQWRPAVLVMAGLARLMAGELDEAQAMFRDLEQLEQARGTAALHMALAERATYALEHRAWADAESLVRRHRASTRSVGVEEYQTSVLGVLAEARLFLRRSDIPRARELLARAQMVRPRLTKAMPHWAVRCLVELARAQLLTADTAGAAASIAQAEEIIRARPGMGVLEQQVSEVRQRLDVAVDGVASAGILTPAELRLLTLLQTHLTFKEMASRLGISPNTAKTESMSLYAKLNVTSRSEAVERAVELGLLESMLPPPAPPLLTRTRRYPGSSGQGLL